MFVHALHRFLSVIGIFWIVLRHTAAGEPTPAATPVPELQRLASSVGEWTTNQKFRSAPDAPAFESTSNYVVRWSRDQQYLISEQRGPTPTGWTSKILITSWNPTDRQIHVVEVNQGGATTDLILWFEGDIRKVLGHRRFGGRLVRTELTVERTTPDEYKFRVDCLDSDRAWVCSEGVSKRLR